jgi:hypothetical protein
LSHELIAAAASYEVSLQIRHTHLCLIIDDILNAHRLLRHTRNTSKSKESPPTINMQWSLCMLTFLICAIPVHRVHSAALTGGFVDHIVESKGVSCRLSAAFSSVLIQCIFSSWMLSTRRKLSTLPRKRPKLHWLIPEIIKRAQA